MGNSIIEAQITLKEEQEKLTVTVESLAPYGLMIARYIPPVITCGILFLEEEENDKKDKEG